MSKRKNSNKKSAAIIIDELIYRFTTQERLANYFGIRKQSITKWKAKNRIPCDKFKQIVELPGGEYSYDQLHDANDRL